MIKEICKDCGGEIENVALTSIPPVYRKSCSGCGRIISEEREEVIEIEV